VNTVIGQPLIAVDSAQYPFFFTDNAAAAGLWGNVLAFLFAPLNLP
jgi:hypothetical protein